MQPELCARSIGQLRVDGLLFKDHNGNGRLDPYEDWRLTPRERAADLLGRMTLQEKVGAMLHANPPTTQAAAIPGAGSAWDFASMRELVLQRHVGAFLNRLQAPPADLARQANALQALAEEERLGIPVILSSDPRSHFSHSQGVSVAAGGFTQWPDAPGFGAAGDAELVRAFADGVREEYRAVGIRMALSPMADLALQPRWHRCSGCFGSSPEDVRSLVQAYVVGMQGGMDGIGPQSVVSVVKHWVGYGATGPEGFDAHNHYGRLLDLRSEGIEDHIRAFTGAFEAGVGGVMPSYGMPLPGLRMPDVAGDIEQVGMSFNRQMVTGVLRGRFGFDGVVISDWHVTDDCSRACIEGVEEGERPGAADIAMPWGVEHLGRPGRFAKAIQAGVDQFGGADDPRWIISAVRDGLLPQSLIDRAVLRILVQKFSLGLFENPYVDEDAAACVVGRAGLKAMALDAQRRSLVVARNAGSVLPLARGRKLFLEGIDSQAAWAAGFTVVGRPGDAELAIVGLRTPHELLHPQHFFGSRYREGRTGWLAGDADLERVRVIAAQVPTVASVYMDRPADLGALEPLVAGIVLHFGLQEQALFEVLSGQYMPAGRLPFDLPWLQSTPSPAGLALRRGESLSF
ncbi:glycoside hydrolase family 3 N-terminal domain-containing protein (plasmid) [Variovorax sp. 375MFSha3.1]|uniref:glycoside hydrolase family 3 protein n=1 Tax=unclassified Variovorax TaxID=663243 RepID=UPI003AAF9336